jgi:F0F1-type ATP synthase delta subunit
MIQVNLECLDDQFFINYFKFLINRIYKILPISETEPHTLNKYLESLILELSGSKELISKIKYDANFISLLATLQYFVDNQYSHNILKREIFKCIHIIQNLQNKYF